MSNHEESYCRYRPKGPGQAAVKYVTDRLVRFVLTATGVAGGVAGGGAGLAASVNICNAAPGGVACVIGAPVNRFVDAAADRMWVRRPPGVALGPEGIEKAVCRAMRECARSGYDDRPPQSIPGSRSNPDRDAPDRSGPDSGGKRAAGDSKSCASRTETVRCLNGACERTVTCDDEPENEDAPRK